MGVAEQANSIFFIIFICKMADYMILSVKRPFERNLIVANSSKFSIIKVNIGIQEKKFSFALSFHLNPTILFCIGKVLAAGSGIVVERLA